MLAPLRSTNSRAEAKYNVSTEFPSLGLHAAAATGNLGLVEYALNRGQPINSVLDGVLPLHAACSGGTHQHEQVVKRLIEHGADVNAPRLPRKYSTERSRDTSAPIVGTSGSTPLHFAAANGNTAIISTLLHYGAQPDRPDKHGVTPEMLARQNGWLECADLLAAAVRQTREQDFSRSTTTGVIDDACDPTSVVNNTIHRKKLQMKRSIDNALNMIKSSSSNLSDAYHKATTSQLHQQQPSSLSIPPSNMVPSPGSDSSPSRPFGEFTFDLTEEQQPNPSSTSTRRPSLPQISVPSSSSSSHRLRKMSSNNNARIGAHNPSPTPRRPRSAGTGAETPPSPSYQRHPAGSYVHRKPVPKLSFMNIFKKSQYPDGATDSVGLGSNSSSHSLFSDNYQPVPTASAPIGIPTSPTSMAAGGGGSHSPRLSSSLTEPSNMPQQLQQQQQHRPSFGYRKGSEGSTASGGGITRAVDLHNALAQQHHHNSGQSPSGSFDFIGADERYSQQNNGYSASRYQNSPPTASRNGLSLAGVRQPPRYNQSGGGGGGGGGHNRNRSGSYNSIIDRSSSAKPAGILLKKPRHNRSTSTSVTGGGPAGPVRFDSTSSAGSGSFVRAKLRECSSAGSLGTLASEKGVNGISKVIVPDSAPPAVEDFASAVDDVDDEEDYGEPIRTGISKMDAVVELASPISPVHTHSLTSSSESSIVSPVAEEERGAQIIQGGKLTENNDKFPFSINQPPPKDDLEFPASPPPRPARLDNNNRGRGDSLSSARSEMGVPGLTKSSRTSSGASWTVTTPDTSVPQTLSPAGRIESPAPAAEVEVEQQKEEENLGLRRAQSPLDINIRSISSHAQAEALVQRAQASILNMSVDGSDDGECGAVSAFLGVAGVGGRDDRGGVGGEREWTPLSAKLAAYGKTLAVERMLREEKARREGVPTTTKATPMNNSVVEGQVVVTAGLTPGYSPSPGSGYAGSMQQQQSTPQSPTRKDGLGRQSSLEAHSKQRTRVKGPRRPNTSGSVPEGEVFAGRDRFAREVEARTVARTPSHQSSHSMSLGRMLAPAPVSPPPRTSSLSTSPGPPPRTPGPSSYSSYRSRSRIAAVAADVDGDDSDYEHPIVRSHTPVELDSYEGVPATPAGSGAGGAGGEADDLGLCRVSTAPAHDLARSAEKLSRMGFATTIGDSPGRTVAPAVAAAAAASGGYATVGPGGAGTGKKFGGFRSLFKGKS